MNDPFDILRGQLEVASGARRTRRRHTGLAVVAATLVLSGTAAAAVTLTGQDEPSKPLTGTLPAPDTTPAPADSTRYAIELMPDLTAGQVGWCGGITLRTGRTRIGGRGCGPAGRPGTHLIAGGGVIGPGGVQYVVVASDVAKVRFGHERQVVPRPDPAIPPGWRVAVAEAQDEATLVLLDARGRMLPTDTHGTRQTLHTITVDPANPPDRRCAIRAGAGIRPVSARLLTEFPRVALDVVRPAFLSCATTVYYVGKRRFRAAVLLDAHDANGLAPLLPNMAAEPAPGAIVSTGRFLSARRAGNAWLVLFGGTTGAERAGVLRKLSVRGP